MEGRLHVGLARGAIESTIHFFVSQWGDGRVGTVCCERRLRGPMLRADQGGTWTQVCPRVG